MKVFLSRSIAFIKQIETVDLIPSIGQQEYIICDRSLTVIEFSSGAHQYTEQVIDLNADVRTFLPELIGLEDTCNEILSGVQADFTLETVARSQPSQEVAYFDLFIKAIEKYLVIIFEDVTESALMYQSSMQLINESEVNLSKLQRFEYCTNKIIASMRDVLFITSPQGRIERANRSATKLFQQKKSELINQSIDELIKDANFNHQQLYDFLLTSRESVKRSR